MLDAFLHACVDTDALDELKKRARAEGRSVGSIVRELINDLLEESTAAKNKRPNRLEVTLIHEYKG